MGRKETTVYKGFATLIIILCHAVGYFGQNSIRVFTPLGGIGVAIFLMLSGYGLNESWNKKISVDVNNCFSYCGWWRKRFVAVWIPYIIIQIVLYWPFHHFDLIPFFLDISLLFPLGHYSWYLQYLFIWYVIFYIVRRIPFLNKFSTIIFSLSSVVMFFLLPEIKAEQSASFVLGVILSEYKEAKKYLFRPYVGIYIMAFGFICLAAKQLSTIRLAPAIVMKAIQLGIKLPIGFGAIIIMSYMRMLTRVKLLEIIGVVSYELYLIHGYVLNISNDSLVGIVLFIVVTIVSSVVFWWLLKKIKPLCYKILHIT